jgi:hypothetical protein
MNLIILDTNISGSLRIYRHCTPGLHDYPQVWQEFERNGNKKPI